MSYNMLTSVYGTISPNRGAIVQFLEISDSSSTPTKIPVDIVKNGKNIAPFQPFSVIISLSYQSNKNTEPPVYL